VDNDLDGDIDEYFVDFNYLARNTVINGNGAAMMAIGPRTPDFTLTTSPGNLVVNLTAETGYPQYRVGVRTTTNDWDSVYTFSGGTTTFTVPVPGVGNHIVSIASVNDEGIESLFSKELQATVASGFENLFAQPKPIELLQNKPNPSDEATMITVLVNDKLAYKDAYISIKDLNGREVQHMNIILNTGMNEIMYDHGYNMSGTYIYTLVIDGQAIESKRMTFTN
jgi:hypothetical protein